MNPWLRIKQHSQVVRAHACRQVATFRFCVRTGTGESPIKIVPGNAEKDRHMAVSETWVT